MAVIISDLEKSHDGNLPVKSVEYISFLSRLLFFTRFLSLFIYLFIIIIIIIIIIIDDFEKDG